MVVAGGCLVAMTVAVGAQGVLAQGGGWPGLQGGPAHLGVAAPGVAPPFHAAWRLGTAPDRALSPTVIDGRIAVANGPTVVVAFDPITRAVRWTRPRAKGSLIPPSLALAGPTNPVVVATEGTTATDSGLIGLDLSTGRELWHDPMPQPVVATPTVDGGVVFVGGQDRFVYAIEAATGKLAWRARTFAPILAAPAVDGGRVFAVAEDRTTAEIRLLALSERSGKAIWSYSPTSGVGLGTSSPTVGDGLVFVGFGDKSIRAVDVQTGAERWHTPVREGFSPLATLALAGPDLFAADDEGGLYRLDARTGTRRWDYQFDASATAGGPLVDGRYVLASLDDGDLAAVEISSGDLRWRGRIGPGPIGPVAPAGDILIVPVESQAGGLVGVRHDPAGSLIRVESPTVLHLPAALVNFAVALLLALLVLLGGFRWRPSIRRSGEEAST